VSNVFDVIRKSGTFDFDFGEIPDTQEIKEDRPAAADFVLDAPLMHRSARMVELRVSTATPIFPFEETESPAAEQYRIIRTKILHHPKSPKVLAVSSASSGDGKTVSSINIAAALALKQDTRTLLIDADLRRRSVAGMLGITSSPGLSEVLCNLSDLDTALVQAEQFPNLSILTAGDVQASPAEMLDLNRLRSLLEQAKQRFEYIILDATPVVAVADYELVQMACDGVIVIARPGNTDRTACINLLRTVPKEKLIGVVLNCVQDWWLWKTPRYSYSNKKP
jgi:capsular exopolysaccharide synthesis family protein